MTIEIADLMRKPQDPAKAPKPVAVPAPVAKPAPRDPKQCPEPGLYRDIPFEDYCGWKALNHSALRKVARSLEHFKDAIDHPADDDTVSKRFGRGCHTLILEPAKFKNVIDGPINDKTNKSYGMDTKAWTEFEAAHPGKVVMPREDRDRLARLAARVVAHPDAGPLIKMPGEAEVCIVWDCPITGMRCKGRIDKRIPGQVRVDLKSTENASDEAMAKSIIDYNYHTQDAFYDIGCAALGLPEPEMWFIAVESERPHGITVFQIGPQTKLYARIDVKTWLHKVKAAHEAGIWPGYPEGLHKIEGPLWWLTRQKDADFAG